MDKLQIGKVIDGQMQPPAIKKRFWIFVLFIGGFVMLVAALFILFEYFHRPDVIRGDQISIETYIQNGLKSAAREKRLGCAGVVFTKNGKVSSAHCFGSPNTGRTCNPETSLFTLASVSKAATALGVLKLVGDDVLTLDEPILPYLKRWRFPGSEETFSRGVTLRHLLSHTSGINDNFGTGGFPLDSRLQSLPDYLDSPMYTNSGPSHRTVISSEPGSGFAYSTMGYAVIQLLIEDKLGVSFNQFMRDSLFRPLEIIHSSYDIDEIMNSKDEAELVSNYDENLSPQPHKRHASWAGASLKMTVTEFGKLISALAANAVVDKTLLQQMYRPQPGTFNSWGLGLELYGETRSIVGHGGGAFPRSGASFRLNPITGNGIGIVMAGGTEMIDPYVSAWMYWETGEDEFDLRQVFHKHGQRIFLIGLVGSIILASLLMKRKR